MPKLTARKVETLKEPGFYGDGGGLYLKIGSANSRSWILRTVVQGRRRDLGLGSANLITLTEAREQAYKFRKIARKGGDPDTVRKRENFSFEEAAQKVYEQLLPTWRNDKHASSWIRSLEAYAFPQIGNRPLHSIKTSDVLVIISPIWVSKNETAKRLKQRISSIFDWAKGAGHYPHENPVNGLAKALPPVKKQAEHLAALDWRDLPGFVSELREREGISAKTLEFIILTGSRSGEARGAKWSEFDLEAGLWTVPAERMKRGVAHRVPLSSRAVEIVNQMKGLDPVFVFPSTQRGKDGKGKEQSVMVFKSLLRRMGHDEITVHGFRSTFRDWCSEFAKVDREVAEAALSHATGNAVERAYARSDLFDRRANLMKSWLEFIEEKVTEPLKLVIA